MTTTSNGARVCQLISRIIGCHNWEMADHVIIKTFTPANEYRTQIGDWHDAILSALDAVEVSDG
jgi:hypothetical protein